MTFKPIEFDITVNADSSRVIITYYLHEADVTVQYTLIELEAFIVSLQKHRDKMIAVKKFEESVSDASTAEDNEEPPV